MEATAKKLSDILGDWKESRGLKACFAIAMLRSKMQPFEWHASLTEQR